MAHGYVGRVLWVDLANGLIEEEVILEKIYREFLGGNGLGIRLLYERMKPCVGASRTPVALSDQN